jgi:hypothetical protein
MRRVAYILTLVTCWVGGMAAIVLWLDGLVFGPSAPALFVITGAWWAAIATVSLAEEVAEALGRSRGPCGETWREAPPTAWRGRGIGQRHYLVPAQVHRPDLRGG